VSIVSLRAADPLLRTFEGPGGRLCAIVAGFSSALVGYIVGMVVAIGEAEPPPKPLENQAP
jgi:hypothetical protein